MEKQPFDDFVIYEKVGNPKTNIYGRSMVSSNNNSRVIIMKMVDHQIYH